MITLEYHFLRFQGENSCIRTQKHREYWPLLLEIVLRKYESKRGAKTVAVGNANRYDSDTEEPKLKCESPKRGFATQSG